MTNEPIEIMPVQSIDAPVGEVLFAIIRSKTTDTESNDPRLVQITIRRSFWAGLVIAVFAIVHILLLLVFINVEKNGSMPQPLIVGLALGQSQLLGVWLALSPWAIWKRVPTVLAILACSALIVVAEWGFFAVACVSVCVPALVFAIPRVLLGWRIDFHPQLPLTLPNCKRGGTVRGMMGFMLACGLFLASARFFKSEIIDAMGRDDWLLLLSVILPITLLSASCTVALMCPNYRAGKAVAVGVVAAFVAVAFAIPKFTSSVNSEHFKVASVYSALAGLPAYAGTLYLLRRLGWRLYQQPPKVALKVDGSSTFDALESPA